MKVTHTLGLVLFGIGALSCAVVFAQGQAQETAKQPRNFLVQDTPSEFVPSLDALHSVRFSSSNFQQQSANLAKQYVKADKEEEKKEIRKKLGDVLAKQFDTQVEKQQKELADLEKQIASLKSLLKKRTDAKPTIIDRRIDQLIQDADGLGWTPGGSNVPGYQQANPYFNQFPIEEKKP